MRWLSDLMHCSQNRGLRDDISRSEAAFTLSPWPSITYKRADRVAQLRPYWLKDS